MAASRFDRETASPNGDAQAHRNGSAPLRFLFTTLGHVETAFYAAAGAELERRGHAVAHLTYSRHAARGLRDAGATAWCLPDLMDDLGPVDVQREAARITREYPVPSFRDIYNTDFVCEGAEECVCVERTVRHMLAVERVFDRWGPTTVVPEVGNETIRTATHLVGLQRGIPVLFLMNTIFRDPLRLAVDDLREPIVGPGDLRPLTPAERADVHAFAAEFLARNAPIRDYRDHGLSGSRARILAHHLVVKALHDRDNPYLRPFDKVADFARENLRARLARPLYQASGSRPYLYFPLHIADDYKLKRLIPHRADQVSIVRLVARALPHGYELVIKEHPNSIGRNPLRDLRTLHRLPNVRLVEPRTSSNELIRDARGVVVISSTAGLEALLQYKPVMTLGRPYYAGAGVTQDLDSLEDLRDEIPRFLGHEVDHDRVDRFLHAAMRRCLPGAPVMIDRSDANAVALAGSLDLSGRELAADPARRSAPEPLGARVPAP